MADRYGRSAAALEECVPEIQEFLSRETIIELADQAEQKAVVAKRRALQHIDLARILFGGMIPSRRDAR